MEPFFSLVFLTVFVLQPKWRWQITGSTTGLAEIRLDIGARWCGIDTGQGRAPLLDTGVILEDF